MFMGKENKEIHTNNAEFVTRDSQSTVLSDTEGLPEKDKILVKRNLDVTKD